MLLLFFYLFLAVGVSFLCSILEAALLSVPSSHVALMKERGSRAGAKLDDLKKEIDRPLSAILSLNTVAHTFGAAGVGAQSLNLFGQAWVAVTSAVVTLLILIFSEIIPKTLGATYSKQLAGFTAHTCGVLIIMTWPLVILSQFLTRLLASKDEGPTVSREEFRLLAKTGHQEGVFEKEESNIFLNLIRFSAIRVEDIMTPRVAVMRLQQDRTLSDVMEEHESIPFSRIPVFGDSDEDIQGYVLKTELMLDLAKGRGDRRLAELKREVLFVPEFIDLRTLFSQILADQEHFAVVVDEYGGFAGVVTLEDVIETLLGLEIVDESDTTEDLRNAARQRWMKRAEKLGIDFPMAAEPEADSTSTDSPDKP
ncbi:MAG: hemolysin family protein [Pseudomonadota bacterium]